MDCNNIINKVAKEQRAGAKLKQRVINKQDRMRREGISKSRVDKVCQIDIISEDKRLKEIYIAVVKELAVKYDVNQKGA